MYNGGDYIYRNANNFFSFIYLFILVGQDGLIMRLPIWIGSIHTCNNLGIFFPEHFSIMILKVSILTLNVSIFKIDTFKVKIDKCSKNKILLHARIRLVQIDGLINETISSKFLCIYFYNICSNIITK